MNLKDIEDIGVMEDAFYDRFNNEELNRMLSTEHGRHFIVMELKSIQDTLDHKGMIKAYNKVIKQIIDSKKNKEAGKYFGLRDLFNVPETTGDLPVTKDKTIFRIEGFFDIDIVVNGKYETYEEIFNRLEKALQKVKKFL